MTTASTLIDEISDQFLVCQICSESFKRPKTLKCLHTFCEECLEIRYAIEEQERPYRFLLSRSLSCPLCFTKTELPPGGVRRLPNNTVVTQLDDVIRRRKLSAGSQPCDICSSGSSNSYKHAGQSRVRAKCLECSKQMCQKCVEVHRKTKVTKDHFLFDVHVKKDVECKYHREEAVRFFCEQCQTCICVLCTFQDHVGHVIFTLAEGIDHYAGQTRTLLDSCRLRSDRMRSQLTVLSRCEASIRTAEDAVRDVAIELVTWVRKRERELTSQLRSIYAVDAGELLAKKNFLVEMLRNLNGTCDLADALLREKSVEFLLVHREITDKLNAILQMPLKDLPEELITKDVKFTASSKNVTEPIGYIHVSTPSIRNDHPDGETVAKKFNSPQNGNVENTPDGGRVRVGDVVEYEDSESLGLKNDPCDAVKEQLEAASSATTTSQDTSTACDSFSSLERMEPVLRNRVNHSIGGLRPPSPRGPDVWVPVQQRRRTQTDQVQLWDSETETVALATDTKYTSTVAVSTVDRSTLTMIQTTCDKTTTTDWLIVSRDQETFTSPLLLLNASVQTDFPKGHSRGLQFSPETLNKLTMTRKPILLERETNTAVVAKFDCEVTARIIGDDKATVTETVSTADIGVATEVDDNEENLRNCDLKKSNLMSLKTNSSDLHQGQLRTRKHMELLPNLVLERLGTDSFEESVVEKDSRTKLISCDSEDFNRYSKNNHGHSTERNGNRLTSIENSRASQSDEVESLTPNTWQDSTQSFSSSSPLFFSAPSSQRVSPSTASVTDDFGYLDDANQIAEAPSDSLQSSSADDRLISEASLEKEECKESFEKESTVIRAVFEKSVETTHEGTLTQNLSQNFPETSEDQTGRMFSKSPGSESATAQNMALENTGEVKDLESTFIGSVDSLSCSRDDVKLSMVSKATDQASDAAGHPTDLHNDGAVDKDIDSSPNPGYPGNEEAASEMIRVVQNDADTETPLQIRGPVTEDSFASTVAADWEERALENERTVAEVPCANGEETKEVSETMEETSDLIGKCCLNEKSPNDDLTSTTANIGDKELLPGKASQCGRKSPTVDRSSDDLTSANKIKFSPKSGPGLFPRIVTSWVDTLSQLELLLPEISEVVFSLKCSSKHCALASILVNISSLITKASSESKVINDAIDGATSSFSSCKVVEESLSNKSRSNPCCIDRAISPVKSETRDSETSTRVLLVSQSSNTLPVHRVDVGIQSKHVSKCDRETSMLRLILLEKETSTPYVHHLHKNTSTDNQVMVDNQTTMATDVTSAYLEATARPVAKFTRGTCTPRVPPSTDRASSPVRFSCVDKAVLARKGENLEPVDTFPSVGKSKGRRPFVSNRKAKLECISEGAIEEETEDSVLAITRTSSTMSSLRLKAVQRSVITVKDVPRSFANRNNKLSLPVSPRPRKSLTSAFAFDFLQDEGSSEVLCEETEEDNFDVS